MASLTEVELLAVWEAGLDRDPLTQALVLAAAASELDQAELAGLALGARDTLLFGLHEQCFGTGLSSRLDCPACGERLEVELSTAALRVPADAGGPAATVAVAGVEYAFRALTSLDLMTVPAGGPGDRRQLVAGCVLNAGDQQLSDEVVEAVAARLADADPQADLELSLSCACCEHEWLEPFDIGGYLWTEIDGYARRLLFDIHALALAYGWSEADVLAVSPTRRRFYLEAVPG